MAVLLGVHAIPVAVLEVDAKVLDRLASQLVDDAGPDRGGIDVRPQSDSAREVSRIRRVLVQRFEGQRSKLRGGV